MPWETWSRRSTNGQTTENLVDPTGLGNLVGQYTSSGSLIAGYTYGLGLVSQVTPGGTNYYQFDALGSTVGLTNATSGLVASYSYLPFGGLLASTGSVANPFTFVGEYGVTSDGSGLYNMRTRSYDPTHGAVRVERSDRARGRRQVESAKRYAGSTIHRSTVVDSGDGASPIDRADSSTTGIVRLVLRSDASGTSTIHALHQRRTSVGNRILVMLPTVPAQVQQCGRLAWHGTKSG